MPLVHIDLPKGKQTAYREAISHIVHELLVSVGVLKDDRFQVIAEHDARELRLRSELPRLTPHRGPGDHPDHLERGGLTVEPKKALHKAIADGAASS